MKSSVTILPVLLGTILVMIGFVGVCFFFIIYGVGDSMTASFHKIATKTVMLKTANDPRFAVGKMRTENISVILSDAQKATLRTLEIDPSTIPSSFTPLEVACFEGKLGTLRTAEIKAGSEPSTMDFFRARSCVQ